MPHPRTADLEALLRALFDGNVQFIVVGGAAAVIHGAPITTQDLDIVPEQSPENVSRLIAILDRLEARFRPVLPDRDLAPTASHLTGTGQLNLTTRDGPLDILRLHDARGYGELLPRTRLIDAGDLRVRVIDLDALIEIKASTGRAKDQIVVSILQAILDGEK
jgi:hypothetical protein